MGFFDDNQQIVEQLAQNAGVAGSTNNIASDTAALAAKNPEDRAQFISDLNTQYQASAHNVPGGGGSDDSGGVSGPRMGSGSSGGRLPDGSYPLGTFGGGFNEGAPQSIQPFTDTFSAPTTVDLQNSPGFLGRVATADRGIQNSAAARGTLLTGGTLKGLSAYNQDLASNEYNNLFGQNMQQYLNKFNIFNTNETNRFNSQSANRNTDYGMFNTNRNFDLSANNQFFNQGMANKNFGLASNNQFFNQGMSLANFGLNANNQQFDQGLATTASNRADTQQGLDNSYRYASLYKPQPVVNF